MMSDQQKWISYFQTLSTDPSFETEIKQIRAKAFLTEFAEDTQYIQWTYIVSRIIRNATAAMFGMELFSKEDPTKLKEFNRIILQFARTWEGLSKLKEGASSTTSIMNAAIAYELAGYQANAACLARRVGRDFIDLKEPNVSDFSSAFLQRLFLQTLLLAESTRKEPEIIHTFDINIAVSLALALAGNGFANCSRYFLSGEESALFEAY